MKLRQLFGRFDLNIKWYLIGFILYFSIIPLILCTEIDSTDNTCSSVVTALFSQVDYECQNGCVLVQDKSNIHMESLALSDNKDLSTCIIFNRIGTLTIDSIDLSSISVKLQSNISFLSITSVETLSIGSLVIFDVTESEKKSQFVSIDNTVTNVSINSLTLSDDFSKYNYITVESLIRIQYLNISSNSLNVSEILIRSFLNNVAFVCSGPITIGSIVVSQATDNNNIEISSNTSILLDTFTIYQSGALTQTFNGIISIPNNDQSNPQISIYTISQQKVFLYLTSLRMAIPPSPSSLTEVVLNDNPQSIKINRIQSEQTKEPNNYEQVGVTLQVKDSNFAQVEQVSALYSYFEVVSFATVESVKVGDLHAVGTSEALCQFGVSFFTANKVTDLSVDSVTMKYSNFQESRFVLEMNEINSITISGLHFEQILVDVARFVAIGEVETLNITNTTLVDCGVFQDKFTVTSMLFQFVSITDFTFSSFSLTFSQEFISQNSNILYQNFEDKHLQTYILSINEIYQITLDRIFFDGSSLAYTFLEVEENVDQVTVRNSKFMNCFAYEKGGCLNIELPTDAQGLTTKLSLSNVAFIQAKSGLVGGAIFGSNIIYTNNVRFESCSSQIGGAIYLLGEKEKVEKVLSSIVFVNNLAGLADDNYSVGVYGIRRNLIFEFNPSLESTSMYINPLGQYSETMDFYPGISYIMQLELLINGEWVSDITFRDPNMDTNMYFFLSDQDQRQKKLQFSQIDSNIQFLYLLFDPFQQSEDENKNKFHLNFLSPQYFVETVPTRFDEYCKEGTEELYFINQGKSYTYCSYCGLSKASLKIQESCQLCDWNYFDLCYSNQTYLVEGYWRSTYTMNTTLIETCSVAKMNCLGGIAIGDQSCSEGHIGAQCLDCDIHGRFWGESYSGTSSFECSKCSSISSNELKLVLGLTLTLLSLLIILKGNVKSSHNSIYSYYLRRLGIIYIGSSLQRMQQVSTLMKVLLFNLFFMNITTSIIQLNLLGSVEHLYAIMNSPLSYKFFSLDCFISDFLQTDFNLGLLNLALSISIPIFIFLIFLLFALIGVLLLPRLKLKFVNNYLILSFVYLFLVAFYPFIFELSLKSVSCVRLNGLIEYSLLDLSLECAGEHNNYTQCSQLSDIHMLAIPTIVILITCLPATIISILVWKKKELSTVKMRFSLGFLYQEYKQSFFLWEFLRMTVKSASVLVQVTCFGNQRLIGVLISLFLIIYLMLVGYFAPFKQKQYSRLESISVLISIFQILTSTLYYDIQVGISNANSTFITVLMIISVILNVIFIAWIGVLTIMAFLQKQLIKLTKKWNIAFLNKRLPLYSTRLRNNFRRLRVVAWQFESQYHRINQNEDKCRLNEKSDTDKELTNSYVENNYKSIIIARKVIAQTY